MKIRLATWKLKTLNSRRLKINPKPQYQRTSVWSPSKKKLLIDSILRGYDIPKFYLRETPNDPHFDYEVTDGQQRMRAIWEFMSTDSSENYPLNEAIIKNVNIKGKKYNELDELEDDFNDFEINIALIEEGSPEEVRSLFARLQMGSSLNKVELRHAMASNVGAASISVVESHPFFKDSKISNSRYKHQDYLDHVLTLSYYNGNSSVKAANIESMYLALSNSNHSILQPYIQKANRILDFMALINGESKGVFKNKWAFVDVYWMLHEKLAIISTVKPKEFIEEFRLFENKRLKYNGSPEDLINNPNSLEYDSELYNYIMAFKYSGNEKANLIIRHKVIIKRLFNENNFDLKK